ncbi:MAG: hypothetical protein V3575_04215 [Candidatus Absconditabacteria bacterium]
MENNHEMEKIIIKQCLDLIEKHPGHELIDKFVYHIKSTTNINKAAAIAAMVLDGFNKVKIAIESSDGSEKVEQQLIEELREKFTVMVELLDNGKAFDGVEEPEEDEEFEDTKDEKQKAINQFRSSMNDKFA